MNPKLWKFRVDSECEVGLVLVASQACWQDLFETVGELVSDSGPDNLIEVGVGGRWELMDPGVLDPDPLVTPVPSVPAPASGEPGGARSLSSRALRLLRLVEEMPGLRRGQAMQKLALRAAEFDRVLVELGEHVVCLECASKRGRPSRRLWIKGQEPKAPEGASELPLVLGLQPTLEELLAGLPPIAINRVRGELEELGLEPHEADLRVFATGRGLVVVLDHRIVWKEWEDGSRPAVPGEEINGD